MGLRHSSCIIRGGILRQVHEPHPASSAAPARLIAADGSLKELPGGSTLAVVSDVLGLDGADTVAPFFVCNADALYFNEHPPALAPGDLLRPGQIYFALPANLLGRPLSTADMAALAVRASAALASGKPPPQRRARHGGKSKKTVRVVPVHEDVDFFNEKLNEQTLGQFGVLLSAAKKSEEKLAAEAERSRLKLKRALSIIQEDAE